MLGTFAEFFVDQGLTPHGYCMLWRWDLITLHLTSDAVTTVAYLTIPFAIWRLVRMRNDIRYPWVGFLFAAFIALCAISHVFGVLTLWYSAYLSQGLVKAACALVSGLTAIRVWQLLPAVIAMPGPRDVEARNAALEKEIARRRAAEAELNAAHVELTRINADLEDRVRRRTADLERAKEELERYAYVASHDLRAPLRALIALPDWVREAMDERYGEVAPEIELELSEMEVQSRRMDQLLVDLLAYARIGKLTDTEVPVDTRALIEGAIKLSALPDGFKVKVPAHLPTIKCVPEEFSLIVRNLISNAVKHHDKASGTIVIEAKAENGHVRFSVADDGPGIPARFAQHIFDVFSTLRPRDEVEGSGMGLAMVKKAVDRVGGNVRLATGLEGRGSRFEFTLPRNGAA